VEPKERFAKNLRERREAAGLTQMEVANRADMDMAEVSRLERGSRDPRLSTVARIAAALDATTEALVHGITWPP
jgi:transcriptional regulator with XRE-family HTH domain